MKYPPKKWIKGKVTEMKRYVARVKGVDGRKYLNLMICFWPANWQKMKPRPDEQFSNLLVDRKDVTATGRFSLGTPAELWTWTETVNGVSRSRAHIRPME